MAQSQVGAGLTKSEVQALIEAQTPVLLPNSYTVDTLPDPSGLVGKYARVTDLFGATTDLVLAAKTGTDADAAQDAVRAVA